MDLLDFVIAETGDAPVTVFNLPESEEARAYDAAFRFFAGTHHDHLEMRWNGTTCSAGDPYLRDRYSAHGLAPADIGAASSRRPDLPTPTAQVIVTRNTGLMFGSPVEIDMVVDENSQELMREVYRFGDLHLSLSEGRNYAGGGGNAIEIPMVVGGRPVLQVYKPSEFKVLKWSETESWQPARIVRQILVPMPCRDRMGRLRTEQFWCTMEWTDRDVIDYLPVPKGWDKDIPERSRKAHGASRCPVTWYKNTPSDGPWGQTDFHNLEPRIDVIDRLGSHVQSAIGQNCDATVFHADEEGSRRRNQIKRRGRGQVWQGSDKASFGLVETDARGLEVANDFWRSLMHDTFELADVVRVTAETAGSLKAAEAIRLLWRASEVRVSTLWPQRANTMRRGLESFYEMAETFGVSSIEAPKPNTMILPSRVMPVEPPHEEKDVVPKEPMLPGAAAEENEQPPAPAAPPAFKPRPPPEKPTVKLAPHKVGKFGFIALKPGPYFAPSAAEKQGEVTTTTAAVSAKLLSKETAITATARAFGVDPHEELRRLHEETEIDDAKAVDNMARMQAQMELEGADTEREEDDEDEAGRKPAKPAKPAADDEEEDDEEGEAE